MEHQIKNKNGLWLTYYSNSWERFPWANHKMRVFLVYHPLGIIEVLIIICAEPPVAVPIAKNLNICALICLLFRYC